MSSARRWGGVPQDYIHVHKWFDHTKVHHGDFRHRALRHHTLGIAQCVEEFGDSIANSDGRKVPTRWVAEQHVLEDHGFIPSLGDWLKELRPQRWMQNARPLSRELEGERAGA
jgi:hypothetical protein